MFYKFLKADCVFSEVRRTTLVNIPVNEQTVLNLIDRTYDTDATIRKILYGSILPKISPRTLSMSQREFIVRKGLGDREPSVKTAARSLITTWMHTLQPEVELEVDYSKGGHTTKSKVEDGVVSMLKLFDLTQDVAVDALLSVFTTEIEVFNNMEFDGQLVVCNSRWLSDNLSDRTLLDKFNS
jgi:condensin complex subunit 3